MERELRIYEMSEAANPVSLARSRLLHARFPLEYAATRARRAISLKAVRHGNYDLWSFVMLPDAPPVSRLPPSFIAPRCPVATVTFRSSQQRVAVNAARFDPPTPRARARKKERRTRRWERREQRDEEFPLRERQGLSPPATSEYLSSGEGEEEESDEGAGPL
jgi:hypothetical protein